MLNLSREHIGWLVDQIREMPQKIADAELREWEFKVKIRNSQMDLDQFKYQFELEIQMDADENGKPKYSNQAKRDAELKRRLSSREECVTLHGEIQEAETHARAMQSELWKLKGDHSALKYELQAVIAVLNGLSDPITREVLDVQQ